MKECCIPLTSALAFQGAVWQCVLNQPALLAATASADFSASIWDAVSGDVKHTFPDSHIVRSVHFSQDSNHLLTAGAIQSFAFLLLCMITHEFSIAFVS